MTNISGRLRLLYIAGGIFVSFFFFGLLQERIFRSVYGEDKEKFVYSLTVVFVLCTVNVIYSKISLNLESNNNEDKTSTVYYAATALTYILGMVTSMMALEWVSFPMQVVAKSAKPIPVLIMGVLIANKTFPIRKYFIIIIIVLGVIMFNYKEDKSSTISFGIGELLLLCSLAMDGLTNSFQERMMNLYKTTSSNFMLNLNKWSLIYVGVAILYSGEFFKFVSFVQKYPDILWNLLALSLLGALGQVFIYKCITEFGTLTCSVVTTTRKFFSVLASILIFGHAILLRQWIGAVLVFSGLLLDTYFGKSAVRRTS